MILRKPYAFFIKMFKPIHLLIGVLIGYLIYIENNIYAFLDKNVYTSINYVGQNIKAEYINNGLYIIPIILIVFFIGILSIMFYKKKPVTFYVVSIFSLIAIIVINVYTINFFETLEESIVAIKSVKLIHDLVLISMIIESVLLIFVIIRGVGVNIQKFNFDSDISKIDINESDNEEFEVNIKFNVDSNRRERNRRIRYLKYAYAENKLLVNILIIVFVITIGIVSMFIIKNREIIYSEKEYISTNTSSIMVDNSYILNTSYEGKTITNNYLLVVDLKVKSNYEKSKVYLADFTINIKKTTYTPTNMYNKYLIDLGKGFSDELITQDYSNYLVVYEISPKDINKKITLAYNDGSKVSHIELSPVKENTKANVINADITETLNFQDKLEGISMKINSYEIQDVYALKYRYCITSDDCINSVEYIKPSLDKSYDKTIIKLNVEYQNSSELKASKFYNLLTTFGYVEYKIDNQIKRIKDIEQIVSTKLNEKNTLYIGVNKEIERAEEIKFVFNVRNRKYVYKIK